MQTTVEVRGFKEALQALRDIGVAAPGKILLRGMVDAVKPLIIEVQQKARRKTGKMAEAYGIAERHSVPEGAELIVGPRISKAYPHGFLWRFWEFGTKKLSAYPVIRPVWDARQRSIGNEFSTFVNKRIEKAARKAARKGG